VKNRGHPITAWAFSLLTALLSAFGRTASRPRSTWLQKRKKTKMSKQQTAKALPTHRVYSVSNNGEKKTTWTEIGAAWPHKDGKGFNLTFTARPLEGAQIVLRSAKAKKAGAQ